MRLALKPRAPRLAVFLAAMCLAVSGFFVGRYLLADDSSARAIPAAAPSSEADVSPAPTPAASEPIDTSKPGWALAVLEGDKALPRFDQEVNGILVGPTAPDEDSGLCHENRPRWAELAEANAVSPGFIPDLASLPATASIAEQKIVICGPVVNSAEVTIELPAGPDSGAAIQAGRSWFDVDHGGHVSVYKFRTIAPSWRSQIASERWEATEAAGHPAAIGRAVLRDEFGESAVVVWDAENGIQLVVRGFDVELDLLLTIAAEAIR
ncbi:MAG: hypothetical protein R3B97_08565 [Dehalococcoidia bacterium]|nr:hypothetical protein [Dehalococcoidia bacterium]